MSKCLNNMLWQYCYFFKFSWARERAREACKLYKIKMWWWVQNSLAQCQDAMVNEEIQSLLDSFLFHSFSQNTEGVELCLVNINHIFDHLASLLNLICKTKQPKKTNRDMWFDSDCKTIRKTLRKVSNQKHRIQTARSSALVTVRL